MKTIYKDGFIVLIFIIALVFKGYIYNFIGNIENIFTKDTIYEVENNILISENKNLKNELNRYQNNYNEYLNYEYKITRLLITNVEEIFNEGIIMLGSKDNIKEKMIVLSENNLLGIVSEVYQNYSLVRFITNGQNISVKVNNTIGIIKSYNYQNKTFIINKIDNFADIKLNDQVYTSNYSIYPEDIYLGEVVKISNKNYNLEKYIEVKSDLDIYNTYYVGVILGTKK